MICDKYFILKNTRKKLFILNLSTIKNILKIFYIKIFNEF